MTTQANKVLEQNKIQGELLQKHLEAEQLILQQQAAEQEKMALLQSEMMAEMARREAQAQAVAETAGDALNRDIDQRAAQAAQQLNEQQQQEQALFARAIDDDARKADMLSASEQVRQDKLQTSTAMQLKSRAEKSLR